LTFDWTENAIGSRKTTEHFVHENLSTFTRDPSLKQKILFPLSPTTTDKLLGEKFLHPHTRHSNSMSESFCIGIVVSSPLAGVTPSLYF